MATPTHLRTLPFFTSLGLLAVSACSTLDSYDDVRGGGFSSSAQGDEDWGESSASGTDGGESDGWPGSSASGGSTEPPGDSGADSGGDGEGSSGASGGDSASSDGGSGDRPPGGEGDDDGWGEDSGGTGGSDSDSDSDSGGDGDGDTEGATGGEVGPEPGQLTSAEWRDLDHWAFWRGLFVEGSPWANMESYWGFYTDERVPVIVEAGGERVANAGITLMTMEDTPVWTARTDTQGRAELFTGLFGTPTDENYYILVEGGLNEFTALEVEPGTSAPYTVSLPASAQPAPSLDLMFVVDTTGSMGDELSYLQAELGNVIEQVYEDSIDSFSMRLSVNFYRDYGDDYLVRDFPFTDDMSAALSQLSEQDADGGGDFPEAVEKALTNAVFEHDWREDATARMIFLVLDAPPRHSAANIEELQNVAREASRQGIRIIPLAGSGVDKETEFLMRFLDVASGGTYTFLTDDSGIGGAHLEPTTGPTQVEFLNDMLVRLISSAAE
jgi:hypothetical protein